MIQKVCLLTLALCWMVMVCAERSPILIIDFGTSNTRMGIYSDEVFEIIPNSHGQYMFPSCVAVTKDYGLLVGLDTMDAASSNNVICGMKRLIGRTGDDPIMQDAIKHYPFQVAEGNKSLPIIKINSDRGLRDISIDEITAFYLRHLREMASTYLGQNVTRVVLTIPDHFTDLQRQAIRHAATLAGLDVLVLLSEPVAAAMAYPYEEINNVNKEQTHLVIHQGTSSLGVFVLFLDYGVVSVVAGHTDPYLGGEVLNKRVMDLLLKTIQDANGGKDILWGGNTRKKLQTEIEKAKLQLSSLDHVIIEVPDLMDGHSFYYNLSRTEFEEINMGLFGKVVSVISDVLRNADMRPDEIDDIIMVGGSTKVPKIQEMVKMFFSQQKELLLSVDPELAILYGSKNRAAYIEKYDDIEPYLDVTRLALGIQTNGGLMSPVIPKFTIIPIPKKHQIFSTATDDQEAVTIQIYEGERPFCLNNKLLGQFDVPIIERSARGVPKITVTFEVDVNYILTVSAQDLNGSHVVSVVIGKIDENSENTKERIREAEKKAEEDKRTKELVETRLCLEQRMYTMRRRLNELGQVNEETDQDSEAGECTGAFNLLEGPTYLPDLGDFEKLDHIQEEQILKDKEEL
ncbi:unnamed protein product [Lymnaea stagnalis]|uniref:Uncharacterized protein n=1 Tax=Lymnaea stagnalis TaxID=6523 RepID=A0AAV2H5F6_LYMST